MAGKPDNMRIWRSVEKTDPSHTKKVNQRGGFTAISAHYQIMRATEEFGPLGIGWGYLAGDPIFVEGIVSVPVTIWHGERDNSYGPVFGGAELKDSRGKPDSDALKKAETDALTKGLSQLGFSADVFLGKFDDNKYLSDLQAEFSGVNSDRITETQVGDLTALAEEVGADMPRFLRYLKIKSLSELTADRFDGAIKALEAKRMKDAA